MAICSIRRHCDDVEIVIYRDSPTPSFERFTKDMGARLRPKRPEGASSWNCKPHALLPLLEEGRTEVVWLDSDVLLNRDCRRILARIPGDTLVACQEYASAPHQGSELRTRGWGLEVGRKFARTLNSAVLRVGPSHAPLLQRWRQLLDDPYYSKWQTKPLWDRPLHCWGDQDVLNALLGSKEFSATPVEVLATGVDVVHCSSFTSFPVAERLRSLTRRMPTFVHCQGGKPWIHLAPERLRSNSFKEMLIHELSPYTLLSKQYRMEVGVECRWMATSSAAGRAFRYLGLGNAALTGLPLAAAASIAKRILRRNETAMASVGVKPEEFDRMKAT